MRNRPADIYAGKPHRHDRPHKPLEDRMAKRIILGVQITDRVKEALEVQSLLTQYGCNIKTRLGLHEVSDTSCSTKGLLLLEMFGEESRAYELEEKLKSLEGVYCQKMVFEE